MAPELREILGRPSGKGLWVSWNRERTGLSALYIASSDRKTKSRAEQKFGDIAYLTRTHAVVHLVVSHFLTTFAVNLACRLAFKTLENS